MSCAKTAEPINLLFGLWTRVGRRKHEFSRICCGRWHVSTNRQFLNTSCIYIRRVKKDITFLAK